MMTVPARHNFCTLSIFPHGTADSTGLFLEPFVWCLGVLVDPSPIFYRFDFVFETPRGIANFLPRVRMFVLQYV